MAYFTLGRKVDPSYKTNRMIFIMTLTLFLGRALFTGEWAGSLGFAVGFFLTWALAREIDPLHDNSAFVAAAGFLILTMGGGVINLGMVFWVVLLLRGITKITGKTITLWDLLSLTGLGIYVTMGQENGIYGLIFMAAMVTVHHRYPKQGMIKGFIFLGGILSLWGIASYSLPVREAVFQMDFFRWILLLLGLVLGIFYGGKLRRDQGIRDDLGELMESRGIFLGYLFYLGMYVVLLTATDLSDGTLSLLFSVILGVTLYRGGRMLSGKKVAGS